MVSIGASMLPMPDFVAKAAAGSPTRSHHVSACKSGLSGPYLLAAKISTCLVNPRACYENRNMRVDPADGFKSIPLVVGARPCAVCQRPSTAARARHKVHASGVDGAIGEIGGQLNLSKARVPAGHKRRIWGLVELAYPR